MASILSAARDAVYPLVETHFSVTKILNVTDADRLNVRFLIEQAEESATTINIALPYCVVAWGSHIPSTFGAVNSEEYEQEVSVYYLCSTRSGADAISTRTLLTTVEDKCLAFINAMRDHNTSFTCLETGVDISHTNPANSYFLTNNLPVFAGVATAKILVGNELN